MPDLTVREFQVIGLVLEGLTNQEIGIRLDIKEQAVKNHLHLIYRKLNIKSRYELEKIFL